MMTAVSVVLACAIATVVLGWMYFRRYAISRPPIGVFNRRDVVIMVAVIVLIPYVYIRAPLWVVAGLLSLTMLSLFSSLLEPVVRRPWAVWALTLLLVGGDLAAARVGGKAFDAVNDTVVALAVIGITNLWAQSGMKAQDAAVLGAFLTVYDVLATTWLPLTTDLMLRLAGHPFAPMVAWSTGMPDGWLGLGMGDLLFATVFPHVMRKAYGRKAGGAALALNLVGIVLLISLSASGYLRGAFPVMVLLGPSMVVQAVLWRRLRGPERTTQQYLAADPVIRPVPASVRS